MMRRITFVIEAIDAVDAGALVVAAQQEEVLRILDLVGKQQADGFDRLLAAIDVVSEEEIVGFRWEPSVFEDLQKVGILTMHVT